MENYPTKKTKHNRKTNTQNLRKLDTSGKKTKSDFSTCMWAFHVSDTHVGRITTETGNGCLLKTPPTVWTPPVWGDGGAMLPHVGATDVMAHFSFMYRNDSTHFRETLRSGFHGQNGERSKQRPMRAPFRWLWRNLARNFVPGGGLVCLKCYHSVYSIAVVL